MSIIAAFIRDLEKTIALFTDITTNDYVQLSGPIRFYKD